jgi:hypothetical protein
VLSASQPTRIGWPAWKISSGTPIRTPARSWEVLRDRAGEMTLWTMLKTVPRERVAKQLRDAA